MTTITVYTRKQQFGTFDDDFADAPSCDDRCWGDDYCGCGIDANCNYADMDTDGECRCTACQHEYGTS